MSSAEPTKVCVRCATERPCSDFHRDRRRKDGLFPWCKPCRVVYDGRTPRPPRRYRTKGEYDKAYRAALSAAERTERGRRQMLWTQYRLSPEDYDRMFEAQGGCCAICQRPETRTSSKFGNRSGRLGVDHDHRCCPGSTSCGKCIRGLLCGACNAGIGALGDNADRVTLALDYLRGWEGGGSSTRCSGDAPETLALTFLSGLETSGDHAEAG